MDKHTVFLDLEETVIDDWFSGNFLVERSTAIREFIDSLPGEVSLGIMSWAILDNKDRWNFYGRFKEPLEEFFDREFDDDLILTVHDWNDLVNRNMPFKMDPEDFADFGSKENVLFWLRNDTKGFPTGDILLFDDVVSDGTVINTETRTIKIINSKRLTID